MWVWVHNLISLAAVAIGNGLGIWELYILARIGEVMITNFTAAVSHKHRLQYKSALFSSLLLILSSTFYEYRQAPIPILHSHLLSLVKRNFHTTHFTKFSAPTRKSFIEFDNNLS